MPAHPKQIKCGTEQGYHKHHRNKQTPCPQCTQAHNQHNQQKRKPNTKPNPQQQITQAAKNAETYNPKNTNWKQANCTGQTHLMYTRPTPQTLKLCHTCPIQTDCLTHALQTEQPPDIYGIRGGTTQTQRRKWHQSQKQIAPI